MLKFYNGRTFCPNEFLSGLVTFEEKNLEIQKIFLFVFGKLGTLTKVSEMFKRGKIFFFKFKLMLPV